MVRPIFKRIIVKIRNILGLTTFITKLNDSLYNVDLKEFIDWSAYIGTFEPDTQKAIKTLLRDGMTFVDVGANSGLYSLLASRIVGKNGKVYSFEPTSYGYKKLAGNIILNKYKNIKTLKIGLSDKNSISEVKLASSYPLRRTNKGQDYSLYGGNLIEEKIEFRTLDSFDITPDVIKIDTDGYEYKILKGAEITLRKSQPTIILELIQKTLAEKGDSENVLIDYLLSLGYGFFTLNFVPMTDLKVRYLTNVIVMYKDRAYH